MSGSGTGTKVSTVSSGVVVPPAIGPMATLVADLIEEIQDGIPDDKLSSLFPALNRAVSIISNRLYILESDLIIGELSVSLFASIDYTAATLAFVNGGIEAVDTITDSASQFVAEGFAANMPIETDCAANPGPFRIAAVAAGTITMDAMESITTEGSGASYTITSIPDYGYLPNDFGGLVEKPYINGKTWELEPLPSQRSKLIYASAGEPKYYKLKGNRIFVTPAASSDATIEGDYYRKPVLLTKMNDYVPFYGAMDAAIQEYLRRVLISGASGNDDLLETFLHGEIDLVVPRRNKKAPVNMPGGIRW